jgi:hypothetical protein
MPKPDSPPPTVVGARAYWYPRMRGGLTVLLGTLAYVSLAAAFGSDPTFATALVGMVGSLVAMGFVWWLEARRAAKNAAAASGPRQR